MLRASRMKLLVLPLSVVLFAGATCQLASAQRIAAEPDPQLPPGRATNTLKADLPTPPPEGPGQLTADIRTRPPEGPGGLKNPSIDFDFDAMEEALDLMLDGAATGYSFSIYHGGLQVGSGAGGKAQLPIDGSDVNFATTTRVEVASACKVFTAMALAQGLEDVGLSLDDSIAPYLHPQWLTHPSLNDVTFRDLLTHRTGFYDFWGSPGDSEWNNLEWLAVLGRDPAQFDPGSGTWDFSYSSSNFRFAVICYCYARHPAWMALGDDDEELADWIASTLFLNHVQNYIFAPAGVNMDIDVFDWDASSQDVRYYNFTDTTINGYSNDDNFATCGPRGFVMRSAELAKVMAAFNHGVLVDMSVKQSMLNGRLGLFATPTGEGTYYSHNGANTDGLGRGRESIWVMCPGDVQIAVVTNSRNNAYGNRFNMVRNAYLVGRP